MKKMILLVVAFVFIVSACAPVTATPDPMMEKPTEEMMTEPTKEMMEDPTAEMMAEPTKEMMEDPTAETMADPTKEMMDGAMIESPTWFDVPLTNVQTGELFTISDFKGKVILVETMAVWCSTCKRQQDQVKALHETLGMMNDGLVSIALDIDPNENAQDLKSYSEKHGYDWNYAVSSDEVSKEIGNLYGNHFLNPPSAPILLIDRKGEVHLLPFGVKSAEDLKESIEPLLAETM